MVQAKSKAGYRLGIVNPLTLVGMEITSILRERSFPFAKIILMTSDGEAGALTEVHDEPAVVNAITDDELEDLDVVFFCGDAAANAEWIARGTDDRFVAIDASQPSAAEGGAVVVAGINLESITGAETVLISPHPIALPIALILHQIGTVATIDLCTATVIQPASEFGQSGVEELAKQTISVLNVQSVPHEVFDRQVAFNLFPAPSNHEEYIVGQIRELTGKKSDVALMITQGTIFHSHTFSLFVKLSEPVDRERIVSALQSNPALSMAEGDQEFGTIDAAGRDEVLIAAVRPDPSIRGGFWIWAVSDNLRRSTGLNAVLVAEKVLFGTATN